RRLSRRFLIQLKAGPMIVDHHGVSSEGAMAIEIERRFLVRDSRAAFAAAEELGGQDIVQGYFGRVGGLRLRVRILSGDGRGETAVVTFKGPRRGYCRLEF